MAPIGWISIETTGRHVVRSKIMEIALVITDEDLHEITSETFVVANENLHESGELRDWALKKYSRTTSRDRTCLLDLSTSSDVTFEQAVTALCHMIEQVVGVGNTLVPAGKNCAFTLQFLQRRANDLYRLFQRSCTVNLDCLHSITRIWYPQLNYHKPRGPSLSRAIRHAYHSIDLLRFYRSEFFQNFSAPPPQQRYGAARDFQYSYAPYGRQQQQQQQHQQQQYYAAVPPPPPRAIDVKGDDASREANRKANGSPYSPPKSPTPHSPTFSPQTATELEKANWVGGC